ncbi:MAG: DUF1801 domain-containing protein [Gemmatimonadota bacterium]
MRGARAGGVSARRSRERRLCQFRRVRAGTVLTRGGLVALEPLDSADPSLGVRHLRDDGDRQLRRAVASRIDAIVQREVPRVRRAVKWHQPFYGVEGGGWFASFSAFSRHVKLTCVRGSYLEPAPPTGTGPETQAVDLRGADALDEAQIASWIRQAASVPGMGW